MQNLEVVLQSLIEYKEDLEKHRQMHYEAIFNNMKIQEETQEQIELIQRELGIYSTAE